MKLHSFVQMELCIKNAFEGLMNAQQQLSLKKLPDLIKHAPKERKTETGEPLIG